MISIVPSRICLRLNSYHGVPYKASKSGCTLFWNITRPKPNLQNVVFPLQRMLLNRDLILRDHVLDDIPYQQENIVFTFSSVHQSGFVVELSTGSRALFGVYFRTSEYTAIYLILIAKTVIGTCKR